MITEALPPFIEEIPGCCTSAIIYGFGEHGEDHETTVDHVRKLVESKMRPVYATRRDGENVLVENGKKCFFAISINPKTIKMLKEDLGFKEVDHYRGVQGEVHILTLHV